MSVVPLPAYPEALVAVTAASLQQQAGATHCKHVRLKMYHIACVVALMLYTVLLVREVQPKEAQSKEFKILVPPPQQ